MIILLKYSFKVRILIHLKKTYFLSLKDYPNFGLNTLKIQFFLNGIHIVILIVAMFSVPHGNDND
jgi:hypothetical protein